MPDQHGLLLDFMAVLAVGGAGVDGVLVVDAFADGVAFDDSVAHSGGGGGRFNQVAG